MNLRAVEKKSAESQTVESLRDAITSGQLPPGTRLTETDLAEKFQVSRGTVRIALYKLAQEGIITQVPYTGWAVTTLTSTDIWELYPLRASLEALGARLAAEQIDANGKKLLREALASLKSACRSGDRSDVAKADFELHRTIVLLGKNERLIGHYRLIEQQFKIFLLASTYSLADINGVPEDHKPIVEAICAGDSLRAFQLTEEHNLAGGRRLHEYVQQQTSAEPGAKRA